MGEWTTRLPLELTAAFGVDEMHCAFLQPKGWGKDGHRPCLTITIPQCFVNLIWTEDGDVQAAEFEPNKALDEVQVLECIAIVCREAQEKQAVILISSETVEDCDGAAAFALKQLIGFERVAVERFMQSGTVH